MNKVTSNPFSSSSHLFIIHALLTQTLTTLELGGNDIGEDEKKRFLETVNNNTGLKVSFSLW
jgi:hypothetical protein